MPPTRSGPVWGRRISGARNGTSFCGRARRCACARSARRTPRRCSPSTSASPRRASTSASSPCPRRCGAGGADSAASTTTASSRWSARRPGASWRSRTTSVFRVSRRGRGRLHGRGRAAGTRRRDAPARAARGDRARARHQTFEAEVLGHEPPDDRRLPHSGFDDDGAPDRGRRRRSRSRSRPTRGLRGARRGALGTGGVRLDAAALRAAVVAVVGASRDAATSAPRSFTTCTETLPRHARSRQSRARARSTACRRYPRVTDVPGPVDLAVIAVPAASVSKRRRRLRREGRAGVVVISAGFAETGEAGSRREAALVAKVRAAGIADGRPELHGHHQHRPGVHLNATFAPSPPEGASRSRRRAARSARHSRPRLEAEPRHLDLRLGRQQGGRLGQRPDPVLGRGPAHRRHPALPRELRQSAQFARDRAPRRRSKPIVAVKAGRSRAGARAASSHTGALAESDRVVDALLRQAGVIRTGTLEELFDVATLLANQPVPKGRRVAIVTNAGGPGHPGGRRLRGARPRAAPALRRTAAALRAFLPAAASVGNPVDMLASASAEHYRRAEPLLSRTSDRQCDRDLHPAARDERREVAASDRARRAAGVRKPVLATFMGAQGAPPVLAPIPSLPVPGVRGRRARAVAATARGAAPDGDRPGACAIDRRRARAVVEAALEKGGGWLSPADASDLLSAAGIRRCRARRVHARMRPWRPRGCSAFQSR